MPNISVDGDTSIHGGAPFNQGLSTSVLAGGKGVALSGQTSSSQNDNQYDSRNRPQHTAGNQQANAGSANVFANGKPLHRVGDARKEGATAGPGVSSVKVNGD